MIVELLTFGDELLDGRRIDSNTGWIGRRCTAMGVSPRFRQTTSDRVEDISEAFRLALSRSDFIISTGGLGPTADDLTFEGLAKAIEKKLVFHPDIYEKIKSQFEAKGLQCPEQNKRQAYLPEGAEEIPNDKGTAPGIRLKVGEKVVFCLPGVPIEMEHLFERGVFPVLQKRLSLNSRRIEKIFHFFGISESHLEKGIEACELEKLGGDKIRVAYTAGFPLVDVTLSVLGDEGLMQKAEERIERELHRFILSKGEMTGEERAIEALQKRRWKIAVAESMTGGLISSYLINVPGSSDVFERGFIAYSNASKVDLLGVNEKTLEKEGAVSEKCALEMAVGARKRAQVEVGLSTTGIAGPAGATDKKQVGLTYIAWVGPSFEKAQQFEFRWDRNRNRMLALYEALKGLSELVEGA